MKIRILPLLVSLCLLMGLSGCAGTRTLDMQALAEELLKNGGFSDELWQIDDPMVKKLYDIEDYTQALVYVGSGATAEELALFAFSSEAAASRGLEKVQSRLETQKESYRAYLPQEVPKLEKAVAKQWGRYVILCVCPGSQEIIDRYTK